MTLKKALELYLSYKSQRNRPRSVETTRGRLEGLIAPREGLDVLLPAFTRLEATELVWLYAEKRKPDTVRGAVREAKTWGRWLVRRRLVEENPWEVELDLELDLPPSEAGKPQLRINEARVLVARAFAEARELPRSQAAGVLVALYLGLRAGEVVGVTARDIDDDGHVLWVAKSKTKAGQRGIEVPDELIPLLQAASYGLRPTDRVWDYTRHSLHHHTKRLCREAGVPVVTPHGLRGMHATFARGFGLSGQATAASLGHTSEAITNRHYVQPGTLENANVRSVVGRLRAPAP